jgi:hypothetical protein
MPYIQITDLKESEELSQIDMQGVSGGTTTLFCGTPPPSIMPGGCYTPPWFPSVPDWVPDLEPPIHIIPL